MKKLYITETQLNYINDLLLENEGTNMKKARKYLENNGYTDPEQRQKVLDALRTDIPNSRLQQCKFLLGVTRLYLDGELNDGNAIFNLNKTLKYISSDAHVNDYDNNLNGESLQTLITRFNSVAHEDLEQSIQKSNSKQLAVNNNYTIVPIDTPDEASKYGKYTSWCVTHSPNMYDSYTTNGTGRFYFCLKNGFENEPAIEGNNCPLDNYGLSMIAVSVNMDGSVNTITCRWNHDNGGNDNIMTIDEIENLLGRNFYQTFKPYSREELHAKGVILFDEVQDLLDSGKKPENIFDYVDEFNDGFARVELNNKCNFINTDGKIISNQWFDDVYNFSDGFARVELNNKCNFINTDGKIISNQWFDNAYDFRDGFARVRLNNKSNFINTDSKFISNQWFDEVNFFNDGFALVRLNNKYNFINIDGKIISNQWFDYAYKFSDGFAGVCIDYMYNFINTDGKIISNQWFDNVYKFNDGFARVELNNKCNFINTDGKIISNQWFDDVYNFRDGFAIVKLNNNYNFINTDGKIIYNQWFDGVYNFRDGFAIVKLNNKSNFINTDGKIISNQWFDGVYDFSDGFARVCIDNKSNFINTDGKIISNQWLDYAYDFRDGFATVLLNNKWYKLNTKGELVKESKSKRTVIITERQKKKLRKAIAAQDQVGGKVNSGIMLGVVGGMCENIDDDTYELAPEKNEISPYYHIKENSEDTITLYHGVNLKNMEYNIEHGGFVPRVCSEGGPKSVWLSEKQYNYNFTFKFDIPKSLLGDKLQQLSNVDYVYDDFISFDDFNCTLIKTDISIHFQGMSVSLNILNDTVSKNQFEIFGKVDLKGYIEAIKEAFTNTPMVYEQYIEPFIEKYCSNLNENRENELKASEVDLSSFNIKKELNPKFWKDGHLDSRIRIKLLDIADDFIKFLGVDWVEPTDVIMTGSLANFNWDGKYSDVDLHIVMDFSDVDENTDLVEEYFQAKKTLWNDDHKDINVFGFTVELYVQEESEDHASSGVYSLYRDTWIVEPDRDTLSTSKVNKQFIKNKVAEYASLIDKLVYLYKKHKDDEYKIRKISEKAEKLWNKIKNSRKEGFEKYDGKEINNYNIIFKSLRRSGYLDKLYKLKTKTYDILSSL